MVMSVVSGILWSALAVYVIVSGPQREYMTLLRSEDELSTREQLDAVASVLQAVAIGILCFTGWLFLLYGHTWISVAMGMAVLVFPGASLIRRSVGRMLSALSLTVVAMPSSASSQHYVHAELSVAFASPTNYGLLSGMAFGQEGELYVLDTNEYRMYSFSPTGEIRGVWGRQGSGPNEFGVPTAVAVSSGNGEVVVLDAQRQGSHVMLPPERARFVRMNDSRTPFHLDITFDSRNELVSLSRDLRLSGRLTRVVRWGDEPRAIWSREEVAADVVPLDEQAAVVMVPLGGDTIVVVDGSGYELQAIDARTGETLYCLGRSVKKRGGDEDHVIDNAFRGPGGIWVQRGPGLRDGLEDREGDDGRTVLFDVIDEQAGYVGTVDLGMDSFLPLTGDAGRIGGVVVDGSTGGMGVSVYNVVLGDSERGERGVGEARRECGRGS